MKLRRVLALCVGAAFLAASAPVDVEARKPPPRSSPPKRKAQPPRKKPRPREPDARKIEEDKNNERLALIGRLKEINDDLVNGELESTIIRLVEKEKRRHELALRVIEAAENPPRPEETP